MNAYVEISCFVARFDKYRPAVIDHVSSVTLFHWDVVIRELSARALHELTKLDPTLMQGSVLPTLLPFTTSADLLKRHGSICGIAEILLGLAGPTAVAPATAVAEPPRALPEPLVAGIAEIVPNIESQRLYRGRGGELVRKAVCRLLECMALAALPLTVKTQVRLLDSIDECVRHPADDVQTQAVAAVRAFTRAYFPVGTSGPSARLQARLVDKYVQTLRTADVASATRGFCLALGALPRKLVIVALQRVLEILIELSKPTRKIGDEPDAETRRNAINALIEVCATVGVGADGLSCEQVRLVFDALLDATEDYSTDKRGDIGSWSRIVAMHGLGELTRLSVEASSFVPQQLDAQTAVAASEMMVPDATQRQKHMTPEVQIAVQRALHARHRLSSQPNFSIDEFFTPEICELVICALLKQLSEKLDIVRKCAGEILQQLLESTKPRIPYIPARPALMGALELSDARPTIETNWALAHVSFPMIVKMMLLDNDRYHDAILSGLVLSVGGLTEAVVKSATSALLTVTKALVKQNHKRGLARLGRTLVALFGKHAGEDRVIVPLFKTTEVLLENDVFVPIGDVGTEPVLQGLLRAVKAEMRGCRDVKKLFGAIDVCVGLLSPSVEEDVRVDALKQVVVLLGHRYPRVRKFSAERLYTKLLVCDGVLPAALPPTASDEVSDLLSTVVWDAEVEDVVPHQASLATLLHLELPQKKKAGASKPKPAKPDELESYQFLIREAGY